MFEDSEEEFEEDAGDLTDPEPGTSIVLTFEVVKTFLEDQPFVCYFSHLLKLARMHIPENCQIITCKEQVALNKKCSGISSISKMGKKRIIIVPAHYMK